MAQDMTVKARYEADVRGYQSAMQAAAASTDKLAAAADRAGKATEFASRAAEKAASRVSAAQEKSTRAQEKAADAAGRLREAQTKLEAARDSGKVQALVAAEERVARAQRDVEATARQAVAAHAEYERAVSDAADASRRLGAEMEATGGKTSRVFDGLRKNSAELQEVGSGLATVGAAMTAAAGGATKAAMDWESAFTGVKKTVDGSDADYAALEDELRGLATTLPTTHREIAGVAEAAGQLGVARQDISGFTKVMVDLGESTNLTAEEAATQIAQISNVMGTMKREGTEGVARFGGALVALGNAGASTEADILAMSQRIAGAGATVGATESDVLALANTLSSMGVKAELGGGVTTRVLLKMKAGVEDGGKSLEAFARTAGVSAEEFAAKFKASPVEAMNLVAQGISRVNAEGGATTQTLKDMGMKGTEEAQVMLALAASCDLLADSLKLGKEAWDENTASNALAQEANKRYATSASQVKIAWNQISDAAIDAGAAILPVVADLMGGVADMVRAFQDLPDPVKSTLGVLAGVGGVVLTAAGGFMMLAPKVLDGVDAFRRLTGSMSRTPGQLDAVGNAATRNSGKISKLGKALGGIATAATVGITIGSLVPSGAVAEADRLAAAVTNIGTGGEKAAVGIDELNRSFTGKGDWFNGLNVNGLDEAFRIMGNPNVADNVDQIASKVLTFGTRSSTNVEFARKNFEALDQQLASMAQGGSLDAAKSTFDQLAEKAKAQGVSQEKLNDLFPAYAAALSRAQAEADAAAQATGAAAGATDELAAAASAAGAPVAEMSESLGAVEGLDTTGMSNLQEAIGVLSDEALEFDERLDGVLDALFRLGVMQQSAAEAAAGFEAAWDGVAAALEENGQTLDITTEAGRKNQQALFDIADAGRAMVQANAEAGASQGELRDALEQTYDTSYAAAIQLGATAEEAELLARQAVGLNDLSVDIDTYLDDAAMVAAQATQGAIEAIPGYKGVSVVVSDEGTPATVQSRIDEITGKTEYVAVTDAGTVAVTQQKIYDVAGVERTVWVGDDGTVYATQAEIDSVVGHHVEIQAVPTGIASTEEALNWLSRTRFTEVQVDYVTRGNFNPNQNGGVGWSKGPFPGLKDGGVVGLPKYATGGRLPYLGTGTDSILGIGSTGTPTAWVDPGEWIINKTSARQFNGVLSAINRDDPRARPLKGFAAGGVPGREWAARSAAPVVNVAAPAGLDVASIAQAVASAARAGAASAKVDLYVDQRRFATAQRQAQRFMEGR